jgi:hypothetical protein
MDASRWTRHLYYRTERTRTTWKLRLGVLVLVLGGVWLTSGWWTVAVGRSLVCESALAPSDAILVENLDQDYLLFERAEELRRLGLAKRVLVTVWSHPATREPKGVELGTTEVMARIARLGEFEVVPIVQDEPITLNAARDVRRYAEERGIRSLIVATSLFRSRRTELVYDAALRQRGIAVRCEPVQGLDNPANWTRTWHGVQKVVEQWFKLQYYRFYVLPFLAGADRAPAARAPA